MEKGIISGGRVESGAPTKVSVPVGTTCVTAREGEDMHSAPTYERGSLFDLQRYLAPSANVFERAGRSF